MTEKSWRSLCSSGFKKLDIVAKNQGFIVYSGVDKSTVIHKVGFRLPKRFIKLAITRNTCKRVVREFCRKSSLPYNKLVVSVNKKMPNDVNLVKKKLLLALAEIEKINNLDKLL